MDGFTVTLVGGRELRRKLDRLEAALAGQLLEDAAAAGALVIANAAKANLRTNAAPDNRAAREAGRTGTWDTGTLARSIHVGGHADLTPDFAGSGIGGNRHGRDSAEVQVGTNVPYARRIELGFSGVDSLGRRYHQSPQPYLRPAFDDERDAAVREVGEALKDLLVRVARGRTVR